MKKYLSFLTLLGLLIVYTGCTPAINQYHVSVDAMTYTHADIVPTTYTIKALGKNTDENSLPFQRQKQHLVEVLNAKGYTPSSHPNLAEQIIYFDYGIEKAQEERRVYHEPDVHFGVSWGYPYGYYRPYYHPFWYNAGYTSYRTYERHYILYNRYVVISAKDQTEKELWRVEVSSVGESDNLNRIIPLLIEASAPYIGTNTQEPIRLSIAEKNEEKE